MPIQIRPLLVHESALVSEVARRMRRTLQHVLGDDAGAALYGLDWLEDRVRFHLDPTRCRGEVFLAFGSDVLVGHCIVRVEATETASYGLFSTTWVEPGHRRAGIARALLDAGEAWLRAHGQSRLVTDTATDNLPLQELFMARGYRIVLHSEDGRMVRLARDLEPAS